jgi:hypothetical protein
MIVFDLRCAPAGHVFEAWFGSSADYEGQQARGLVQCPLCGSGEVGKAVMAPRVSAKGNQRSDPSPSPAPVSSDVEGMKKMLAAMATAQKKLLENSEHVGAKFADEARAIHHGESPQRAIHGRATQDEARSLAEDGIAVAPLPFPVIDEERKN